nr:hypothetical protein [Pandoravirus massiliensis]
MKVVKKKSNKKDRAQMCCLRAWAKRPHKNHAGGTLWAPFYFAPSLIGCGLLAEGKKRGPLSTLWTLLACLFFSADARSKKRFRLSLPFFVSLAHVHVLMTTGKKGSAVAAARLWRAERSACFCATDQVDTSKKK